MKLLSIEGFTAASALQISIHPELDGPEIVGGCVSRHRGLASEM